MRLSYFLLVVAAGLLASGSAVTDSGRFTDVSTMESPELTGTGQVISSEKRSLRFRNDDQADEEEEADDDDDNDDDDDDGEERGGGANIFDTKKINSMLASVKRAKKGDDGGMDLVYKRLGKWAKYEYNTYHLPEKLQADKYTPLRQKFQSWLYIRPQYRM